MNNKLAMPKWLLGIICAGFVLLIALGIVLIPRDNTNSQADSSSGSPTIAGSDNAKGLSEGCAGAGASEDDTVRDSKPKDTEWITTNSGWTGPVSKSAGPLAESPLRHCFEHSAEGALYASTWVIIQLNTTSTANETMRQMVANPVSGDVRPEKESVLNVAGYKYLSYSPERASIRLAFTTQNSGSDWYSMDVTMVWENGDWKLRLPDSSNPNSMNVIKADKSSFIHWGTV